MRCLAGATARPQPSNHRVSVRSLLCRARASLAFLMPPSVLVLILRLTARAPAGAARAAACRLDTPACGAPRSRTTAAWPTSTLAAARATAPAWAAAPPAWAAAPSGTCESRQRDTRDESRCQGSHKASAFHSRPPCAFRSRPFRHAKVWDGVMSLVHVGYPSYSIRSRTLFSGLCSEYCRQSQAATGKTLSR